MASPILPAQSMPITLDSSTQDNNAGCEVTTGKGTFRLYDLPRELRDMVFDHVYEPNHISSLSCTCQSLRETYLPRARKRIVMKTKQSWLNAIEAFATVHTANQARDNTQSVGPREETATVREAREICAILSEAETLAMRFCPDFVETVCNHWDPLALDTYQCDVYTLWGVCQHGIITRYQEH